MKVGTPSPNDEAYYVMDATQEDLISSVGSEG